MSSSTSSVGSGQFRKSQSDLIINYGDFIDQGNANQFVLKFVKAIKRNRFSDIKELFGEYTPEFTHIVDKKGNSMIDIAAKYGRLKIFKLLLNYDFEINKSTFRIAYSYSRKHILNEILNRNPDNIDFNYVLKNPLSKNKKYLRNSDTGPRYGVQSSPKDIYKLLIKKANDVGKTDIVNKLIKVSGLENDFKMFQTHFKYKPGGPGYRLAHNRFKKALNK